MLPPVSSAREPTQSHEQPRGGGVHEKEGQAAQGKSCQNQTGSARFGAREIGRASQFAIPRVTCWYCSEPRLSFNKIVVTRYRIHLEDRLLAPGTINVRLAAVRRLAYVCASRFV